MTPDHSAAAYDAAQPDPRQSGSTLYRWYLSAAAMREYLAIAGLVDDDGGPQWARGERELGAHIAIAREVGCNDNSIIYRTGRVRCGDALISVRLEFYVRHTPQRHGPLPQLVSVRNKGNTRGRRLGAK